MSKTVALISTLDTKEQEALYLADALRMHGCDVFMIDSALRGEPSGRAGASRIDILRHAAVDLLVYDASQKAEKVKYAEKGLTSFILEAFSQKRFDAVVALGGMQNALLAVQAMQALPIGFPKFIVSSVLCGNRQIGSFVGTKDIVLIPTVADFMGMNPLMRTVLNNAAAMISGTVREDRDVSRNAERPEDKGGGTVGLTCMGVTEGLERAAVLLRGKGFEVAAFHATGAGGRAFEELALDGALRGLLDLTLHEIVSNDIFAAGPSYDGYSRLKRTGALRIPMVLSPGGLDFIDLYADEFFSGRIVDPAERKYILHNAKVVHIKLTRGEATRAAEIVAERINGLKAELAVVIPLRGFRTETLPGQPLYDPEVDEALRNTLREGLNRSIRYVEVDASINDAAFAERVCAEFLGIL